MRYLPRRHLSGVLATMGFSVPGLMLVYSSTVVNYILKCFFQAPLDYQNPDLGRASIPLIKYSAEPNSSDGQYLGMILINPGGPGGSGVLDTIEYAHELSATMAGTNWDIVGFDPRGMWFSEPVANCSNNTIPYQNITLGARSVPRVTDEFYESYIEFGEALGEQCEKEAGGEKDAGPHMSTATNARDMLSIVHAFAETEDGKRAAKPSNLLNFYGVSYGTFLGQTFASMFPDSVGNMVLDGVLSPEAYLANFTSSFVNDLDGVIATFFIYCYEAGPSNCPYYTGHVPKDIYERFNRSFAQLDPQEATTENWPNATDLEAALSTLKLGLLFIAGQPLSYFSSLPQVLLDLETAIATQDIRSWTEKLSAIVGDTIPATFENPEWDFGVTCTDQNHAWYNKTLQDFGPLIAELKAQSIIGEVWSRSVLSCTGWSIQSNDIFTGPFGGDTATPILFVSNTYDPVTAIEK